MRHWAYGITCTPARKETLLPRTIASLKMAGFTDPRLFVDCLPHQDLPKWLEMGLPITSHWPKINVFANWSLALGELYLRSPEAERFAIFQDDILVCSNLRSYLDECKYPDGPFNSETPPGYWNLYSTPRVNELGRKVVAGKQGWFLSQQNGRGALALVFSRQAVITLLSSPFFIQRPLDKIRGWRYVDGGILESFKQAGWKEYVHYPCLVGHTGRIAVMDKGRTSDGKKEEYPAYVWPSYYDAGFVGEDYDPLNP